MHVCLGIHTSRRPLRDMWLTYMVLKLCKVMLNRFGARNEGKPSKGVYTDWRTDSVKEKKSSTELSVNREKQNSLNLSDSRRKRSNLSSPETNRLNVRDSTKAEGAGKACNLEAVLYCTRD